MTTAPFPVIAKRAALWLAFLAPVFYLTYGFANWSASQRDHVGSIVYDWERTVPFLAWTIIPYWSINAFYALSLFLNASKSGVDRLAARYLTAQIVAVSLLPRLPAGRQFHAARDERPAGLHVRCARRLRQAVQPGAVAAYRADRHHLGVICAQRLRGIAAAALGHLVRADRCLRADDVPASFHRHSRPARCSASLRCGCFPPKGPCPSGTSPGRAIRNAGACAASMRLARSRFWPAPWLGANVSANWLLLLWPSLALAIVAFAYAGAGPKVFQKSPDGNVTLASRLLLLPYRLGARINAWAWTRRLPPAVEIADGVHLGRFPDRSEAGAYSAIIDLTAEFARPRGQRASWHAVPLLDLVKPDAGDIDRAAALIASHEDGTVLVCCALGFQRSALAIVRWLVVTGRAGG